mmetsp:Transcript_100060/g.278765  ORF Transcript_100060/g.278765 Transcript_100060/m.278765 type:complete len:453 (-) Transcript_100060:1618-2976(-)
MEKRLKKLLCIRFALGLGCLSACRHVGVLAYLPRNRSTCHRACRLLHGWTHLLWPPRLLRAEARHEGTRRLGLSRFDKRVLHNVRVLHLCGLRHTASELARNPSSCRAEGVPVASWRPLLRLLRLLRLQLLRLHRSGVRVPCEAWHRLADATRAVERQPPSVASTSILQWPAVQAAHAVGKRLRLHVLGHAACCPHLLHALRTPTHPGERTALLQKLLHCEGPRLPEYCPAVCLRLRRRLHRRRHHKGPRHGHLGAAAAHLWHRVVHVVPVVHWRTTPDLLRDRHAHEPVTPEVLAIPEHRILSRLLARVAPAERLCVAHATVLRGLHAQELLPLVVHLVLVVEGCALHESHLPALNGADRILRAALLDLVCAVRRLAVGRKLPLLRGQGLHRCRGCGLCESVALLPRRLPAPPTVGLLLGAQACEVQQPRAQPRQVRLRRQATHQGELLRA